MEMIVVRPYELKDLSATVELWYKTWHQTFPNLQHPQPYSVWEVRLSDQLVTQGEVWIAEAEKIVGFLVVMKNDQILAQLFVEPSYQNQGIGSSLMTKAKAISPQGLTLHTLQSNTKACKFYEKHGFIPGQLSINQYNEQPQIEYNWRPAEILN